MVVAGRVLPDGDVAIMMVEAEATSKTDATVCSGAKAPDEVVVAEGLEAAKGFIKTLCEAQSGLAAQAAKPVTEFPLFSDYAPEIGEAVTSFAGEIVAALGSTSKTEREEALAKVREAAVASLSSQFP